jgi:hypothetical protein
MSQACVFQGKRLRSAAPAARDRLELFGAIMVALAVFRVKMIYNPNCLSAHGLLHRI